MRTNRGLRCVRTTVSIAGEQEFFSLGSTDEVLREATQSKAKQTRNRYSIYSTAPKSASMFVLLGGSIQFTLPHTNSVGYLFILRCVAFEAEA
jgi:hypothetical protein